ncbi:uncharacterized protein MKK02DRAFT_38868 [Dioszegia hungarica]|uniref:BRCT domain-containing protein n=1 Tax=Dioszegia hungarica TaxID=4972 RepID=A0AA38H582_9TREE|nr:uncharacterized protein MKK02DRAFT_38868 [Dioszegia hungarica]KAI9634195.1 hypothetical protein MKK02DRAFT_38868 [Dioszegia hungarica]
MIVGVGQRWNMSALDSNHNQPSSQRASKLTKTSKMFEGISFYFELEYSLTIAGVRDAATVRCRGGLIVPHPTPQATIIVDTPRAHPRKLVLQVPQAPPQGDTTTSGLVARYGGFVGVSAPYGPRGVVLRSDWVEACERVGKVLRDDFYAGWEVRGTWDPRLVTKIPPPPPPALPPPALPPVPPPVSQPSAVAGPSRLPTPLTSLQPPSAGPSRYLPSPPPTASSAPIVAYQPRSRVSSAPGTDSSQSGTAPEAAPGPRPVTSGPRVSLPTPLPRPPQNKAPPSGPSRPMGTNPPVGPRAAAPVRQCKDIYTAVFGEASSSGSDSEGAADAEPPRRRQARRSAPAPVMKDVKLVFSDSDEEDNPSPLLRRPARHVAATEDDELQFSDSNKGDSPPRLVDSAVIDLTKDEELEFSDSEEEEGEQEGRPMPLPVRQVARGRNAELRFSDSEEDDEAEAGPLDRVDPVEALPDADGLIFSDGEGEAVEEIPGRAEAAPEARGEDFADQLVFSDGEDELDLNGLDTPPLRPASPRGLAGGVLRPPADQGQLDFDQPSDPITSAGAEAGPSDLDRALDAFVDDIRPLLPSSAGDRADGSEPHQRDLTGDIDGGQDEQESDEEMGDDWAGIVGMEEEEFLLLLEGNVRGASLDHNDDDEIAGAGSVEAKMDLEGSGAEEADERGMDQREAEVSNGEVAQVEDLGEMDMEIEAVTEVEGDLGEMDMEIEIGIEEDELLTTHGSSSAGQAADPVPRRSSSPAMLHPPHVENQQMAQQGPAPTLERRRPIGGLFEVMSGIPLEFSVAPGELQAEVEQLIMANRGELLPPAEAAYVILPLPPGQTATDRQHVQWIKAREGRRSRGALSHLWVQASVDAGEMVDMGDYRVGIAEGVEVALEEETRMEERRIAEEMRFAEEARKAEEERIAERERKDEEESRRAEEEKRRAYQETIRAEVERRLEAEAERKAEEERKAEAERAAVVLAQSAEAVIDGQEVEMEMDVRTEAPTSRSVSERTKRALEGKDARRSSSELSSVSCPTPSPLSGPINHDPPSGPAVADVPLGWKDTVAVEQLAAVLIDWDRNGGKGDPQSFLLSLTFRDQNGLAVFLRYRPLLAAHIPWLADMPLGGKKRGRPSLSGGGGTASPDRGPRRKPK